MENRNNTGYCLFSDITTLDVDWLWYPYIPCGKITLLQGDPGDGKSTLIMDLIAKLTTGRTLPDGRMLAPVNVIYQCSEDGLGDTVKPRLESAKANCMRVGYIEEDLFGLSLDDERIRTAIVSMNARLAVIDPFQAYIGDTDLSSAVGIRKLLRRLSMWAASANCAIVLVGHFNKKGSSNELYRGLGSIDLVAAARSVIQIERDSNNPEVRVVKHVKSSLAPKGNSLFFTIDNEGRVKWYDELPITSDAPNCINDDYASDKHVNKQELAAFLMCNLLSNGPVEASIIKSKLLEKGISSRTIMIAKGIIAVESHRKNNKWYWNLPNNEDKRLTTISKKDS